jgi:uncharacterized membrane protein YfcA
MIEYIIEFLLGLLSGGFLGITGFAPLGLLIIVLDYLGIGDYKTNLGSILFLNLFPISIGSVYEFWQSKKINFKMSFILLISVILGSYISSHFVIRKEHPLSIKTLKYISAIMGLIISIVFFYSAYNEKN